jgi:FAD/FMN-containing dehydrogenase
MVQASTGLTQDQARRLRGTFTGEIVTPADTSYDESRRLWNAVHDRYPAVIVRPTTRPDVATAIRFAREQDLELAVRSGGHSPAGHSGSNGGLVVDLSKMRGVSVDPASRMARVNGGALLGELDIAALAHGLVCPTGVIGHTGVAG